MNIALDDAKKPEADSDARFFNDALQSSCHIFQCLFQKLPYHLEYGGCDMKISINHNLTDLIYAARRKLAIQSSGNNPFI